MSKDISVMSSILVDKAILRLMHEPAIQSEVLSNLLIPLGSVRANHAKLEPAFYEKM